MNGPRAARAGLGSAVSRRRLSEERGLRQGQAYTCANVLGRLRGVECMLGTVSPGWPLGKGLWPQGGHEGDIDGHSALTAGQRRGAEAGRHFSEIHEVRKADASARAQVGGDGSDGSTHAGTVMWPDEEGFLLTQPLRYRVTQALPPTRSDACSVHPVLSPRARPWAPALPFAVV